MLLLLLLVALNTYLNNRRVLCCDVMCVASARSSSRASSSSCTSSIAEEDDELSEPGDGVAAGGDVFVPPRPLRAHRTTQRAADETARRKAAVKPSATERRAPYLPKSPKTVSREPPSSPATGWRSRPQPYTRPDAGVTAETSQLSADNTGCQVPRSLPTTPINTGDFKVPKTPPVPSSRPRDAGSRIPKTMPKGGDRRDVDGTTTSRPATAVGVTAESKVSRAATPPPQRLHSSNSDMALSAASSGSSTRTQSRIPTRTGARPTQRDTGASSRGSSPGSVK